MTNISDDKILAHLDRILGDRKPITADIFLNNYCNNKCPYCTYRRWEFEAGARYMKFEEFKAYAEKLESLGVLGFILTGGGEPTISKDFEKITAYLEEKKLHYGINTNFNKLVYIKPDYLKVSLDGWDEDSYEQHRGVRAYETVRENIQKYAEWKKQHSPHTSLGIQLLAYSVDEVNSFYEANKDLNVDYMSIRPVESTRGNYYKDSFNDFKKTPEAIIEAIKKIAEKDSRVVLNFKWNLIGQQEKTCSAAWSQIALNEKGEVIFCCHKPYQIIGHILDEDIMEKKRNAKTDMDMCDIPCRLTAPNKTVSQLESKKKDIYFI